MRSSSWSGLNKRGKAIVSNNHILFWKFSEHESFLDETTFLHFCCHILQKSLFFLETEKNVVLTVQLFLGWLKRFEFYFEDFKVPNLAEKTKNNYKSQTKLLKKKKLLFFGNNSLLWIFKISFRKTGVKNMSFFRFGKMFHNYFIA